MINMVSRILLFIGVYSCLVHAAETNSTQKVLIQKVQEAQKKMDPKESCSTCLSEQHENSLSCDEKFICNFLRKPRAKESIYYYENSLNEKYSSSFLEDLAFPNECKGDSSSKTRIWVEERKQISAEERSIFTWNNTYEAVEKKGTKLDEWNKRYQVAKAKWVPLFENVRKKVLSLLESRKNPKNSAAIDNAIRRIQLITLKIPNAFEVINSDKYSEGCAARNAFMTSDGMQVVICPQMLESPEGMMRDLMGHELGHAFDPCSLTGPIKKMKNGKFIGMHSLASAKDLRGPNYIDRVKFKDFPLREVAECLADERSAGIPFVSTAEAFKLHEQFLNDKLAAFSLTKDKENLKFAQRRLKELQADREKGLDKSEFIGSCFGLSKSSKVGETFADWVATEVVANMAEEEKDVNRRKELLAESFLYVTDSCGQPQRGTKIFEKTNEIFKLCGTDLETEFKKDHRYWFVEEKHPESRIRVEKIRLAHPVFQRYLGCRSESARYCP